jgi:hypothetical protein
LREDVALKHMRCVVPEIEKTELAKVSDEYQTVVTEIAEGLRIAGEHIQAVGGGLDLSDAALGVEQRRGFGIASGTPGPGKEPSIRQARSLIAELCGEEDWRLESSTSGIQ